MGGTNPFCDRRHTRKRRPRVLLIILCKINQSLLLALVVSWSFVINHAGARQLCVAAFRFGRGGRSANPSDNTQPQCTQTSPAKPVTTSTTKRSLLSFLFGTGSVKDDEGELNASSKNLYSSVLIEPDMKSGEFPRYHPGRSDRQQANGAHVSYSQTLDSISNLRETAVSAQFNSADSKEERSEIDFSSHESSKHLVETVKKHSILHTFTIPNHIHNLHQQAMRIASKNSEINETIPSSHTSSYNVSSKLSKLPQVLYGLNISNKKFFSWVQYTLEHDFKLSRSTIESELSKYKYSHMSTRQLDLENATLRDWMRTQWKSRLLVSERTEPLAVYESDTNACNKDLNASGDRSRLARLTTLSPEEPQGFDSLQNEASKKRRKRGGFRDLLSLYADRLLGIIVDEMDGAGIIKDDPPSVPFLKNHVHDVKLFAWLENHFGVIQVARLKGGRFGFFWPYMNENDQLGVCTYIFSDVYFLTFDNILSFNPKIRNYNSFWIGSVRISLITMIDVITAELQSETLLQIWSLKITTTAQKPLNNPHVKMALTVYSDLIVMKNVLIWMRMTRRMMVAFLVMFIQQRPSFVERQAGQNYIFVVVVGISHVFQGLMEQALF